MRECSFLILVVALLVECAFPHPSLASVGRMVPLWEHIGYAATIVVAEVAEVGQVRPVRRNDGPRPSGFGRVRAVLKTKETWKGTAPDVITFEQPYDYARDLIRSGASGSIIAFFHASDRPVPIVGSDGVEASIVGMRLHATADELDALRDAVRDVVAIQGPAAIDSDHGIFPEKWYGDAYHRWLVKALTRRVREPFRPSNLSLLAWPWRTSRIETSRRRRVRSDSVPPI